MKSIPLPVGAKTIVPFWGDCVWSWGWVSRLRWRRIVRSTVYAGMILVAMDTNVGMSSGV